MLNPCLCCRSFAHFGLVVSSLRRFGRNVERVLHPIRNHKVTI